MLQKANCPVWPWNKGGEVGLLVEAFPMAQLYRWNLPHEGYNGRGDHAFKVREKIISGILPLIDLGEFQAALIENADALDAVICAFAPIAVNTGKIAVFPDKVAILEGWIAIHA